MVTREETADARKMHHALTGTALRFIDGVSRAIAFSGNLAQVQKKLC
jgi:hypothetical protein